MKIIFVYMLAARVFAADPCSADRARLCPQADDQGAVAACLLRRPEELDPACRQDLERYVGLRKQASSRGGGALGSFGGANAMGPPVPIVTDDSRYSPGTPSLTDNKLNLGAPIAGLAGGILAGSLAGEVLRYGSAVTLDNGRVLAPEWDRLEAGAQYFEPLSDKRMWSLRGSVGYAGDQLAGGGNDLSYSVSATYGYPSAGAGYWVLLAYFSNDGPFGAYVPIPGFIYVYKTPTFTGLFGFPVVSMQWTPEGPWSYGVALFGPTAQAEAAHGGPGDPQYFANFAWTRQNFIPATRPHDLDRLTIEEKKIGLGLRSSLVGVLSGEISAGQAFARALYIGTGISNREGGNALLPDEPYVQGSLRAKF